MIFYSSNWKKENPEKPFNKIEDVCSSNVSSPSGLNSCIEEHFYDLNETVIDPFHSLDERNNLLVDDYWNKTMNTIYFGRCHTFQYPHAVGTDSYQDSFIFPLDVSKWYQIYFHDPAYYLQVTNPLIAPRLYRDYRVTLYFIINFISKHVIILRRSN